MLFLMETYNTGSVGMISGKPPIITCDFFVLITGAPLLEIEDLLLVLESLSHSCQKAAGTKNITTIITITITITTIITITFIMITRPQLAFGR